MRKINLLFIGLAFLTFKNQAQTVTDYDGNIYDTVHIGTQVWLKENLKVTHYRNGDIIPNDTNNITWTSLSAGARCYYNNDSSTYVNTYGALYNWFAVSDSRNIAPIGWHVATETEWMSLINLLIDSVAGGKLKEIGTTHWQSPNTGATNESGFTALPGGNRDRLDGTFIGIGAGGYWWSSTSASTTTSRYYHIFYNHSFVDNGDYYNNSGFSVRCVKDNGTGIKDINFQEKLNIYPNPAIDLVYINCAEKQNLKMQIYNVVGECVLQRELNSGTNNIDISSLSKGIYIIKLTATNWTIQRKLTKE